MGPHNCGVTVTVTGVSYSIIPFRMVKKDSKIWIEAENSTRNTDESFFFYSYLVAFFLRSSLFSCSQGQTFVRLFFYVYLSVGMSTHTHTFHCCMYFNELRIPFFTLFFLFIQTNLRLCMDVYVYRLFGLRIEMHNFIEFAHYFSEIFYTEYRVTETHGYRWKQKGKHNQ